MIEVLDMVLQGRPLEAITLIEKEFPNLLSSKIDVAFKLQAQVFIEFIRERKTKEALEYAQQQVPLLFL
jgi:hypothetical protein